MFRRILGRQAEDIALVFLKKRGFKIIDRNFRCRLGEIDIVAVDGREFVFVEVRSSNNSMFNDPSESITGFKINRLRNLALFWFNVHNAQDYRMRFDVIAIVFNREAKGVEINHIKAAF